jgi:hypothetical protein
MQYLHQRTNTSTLLLDILTTSAGGDAQLWIETLVYDTSTKRSSNLTPFNKISKSGDGEGNGDIFPY